MSTKDHPDWWRPMGGQNSQDSILERRSLVWNDNAVEDGDAPPAFYTCLTYKGKFYPRGCRGMIESIWIYCRDAGADRLTLRYSPHPGLGPVGEVTITPLAGWSWVGAVIEEMWNYDSLFIWVVECDAGTDWAYDAVQPYDGHWSQDTGATWEDMAVRPFIRVVYTGETPGDVPVSGIVNNIEIPSLTPLATGLTTLNVPAMGTLTHLIEGVGYFKLGIWHVGNDLSRDRLRPVLRVDGNRHDLGNIVLGDYYLGYLQRGTGDFWFGQYDAATHQYTLLLKLRIPFRRTLEIGWESTDPGAVRGGSVWASVELLA